MLIYGHTPTPPPPAALTQEQLARDAGQLVQAHAALDKLVSDTDRSANSLLDRIQQVVNCTEEVNKVLDDAGLRVEAGIVESVKTLKRRCDHHAKACEERGIEVGRLAAQIHDLKDRNKRLHAAQGSGNSAAAELERVRETLSKIVVGTRTVPDMAQVAVTMNLNQRGEIWQLRGANTDPLNQRSNLVEENNRLRSQLQEAGDVLNKELAITKGGSLPVRIQRLIDCVREGNGRGQEAKPKPKPWSVSQCSVMHADGNRRIHCTSRELAEQTCEMLNRQEAR